MAGALHPVGSGRRDCRLGNRTGAMVLSDVLAVLFGVLLGTLASVPVALIIAASARQPRDMVDFGGWYPPD